MKYFFFILGLLILPVLALAQTTTGSTGFVPLTNVPFIQAAGNSVDLPQFLNGLYRICIGIAAVVAVLQIMRAGILYMGGDSVTEKKEAKNLIALSIGGLILVLSPVVVFSIINPEILSLEIKNLGDLAAQQRQRNLELNTVVVPLNSEEECAERDGTPVDDPNTPTFECRVPTTSPDGTGFTQQCEQFESVFAIAGNSCRAAGDDGYIAISNSCCAGIAEGSICCGRYESVLEGGEVDLNNDISYEIYQEWNTSTSERVGEWNRVPRDNTRYVAYNNACSAAGGTMERDWDASGVELLFTARWGTCSAATEVPSQTGNQNTVYQCAERVASCTLPAT
ncbi:MAG TPA: pilin [Candidatus Paceibacterota bacterium]|nr:pilin [Candidatus Paceibacterota bacterium]